MSSILIPEERKQAWKRYAQKFGKQYPAYYIFMKHGDDWEKEVADIDRRIRENDPAPDKKIPDGVVF